jgi:hypothetical protein
MSDSCSWSAMQREAIAAWVEEHHADLPRTLSELATYPMVFRRVIARALPIEPRVSLWREHLTTVSRVSMSGTAEQRALIADVIEQLPAIVGDDPARTEASMRSLEPRMRALLTHEQLIEAFASLGPPEPLEKPLRGPLVWPPTGETIPPRNAR